MPHTVTLIPGDGIGPEIAACAVKCIEATGVRIKWEKHEAGEKVMRQAGTPLPESVLSSVRNNGAALKGPITTPIGTGFRSVNVALRKELDLFACLRPCKWYKGVRSPHEGVDLVVVRENTEDLYAGIEYDAGTEGARRIIEHVERTGNRRPDPDSAVSLKLISEAASRRIIKFAFEYAVANGRKKITAVHKANIMKATDGLFMRTGRQVAEEYRDRVEFEERLIDNMCMQLVQKPLAYDVMVLPNLYGDIVSDLCAGLVGGLGMTPGANIGDSAAVFEPTHGSAPKYAGKNKVNPAAIILSGVMMLRHLGEDEAAGRLESAVASVVAEGKHVTYDLNPASPVSTTDMCAAILEKL